MFCRVLFLLIAACFAALGCARETPSARSPEPSFSPWLTPPGYAWPPRSLAAGGRTPAEERALARTRTDPITTAHRRPLPSDSLIPGGEACLAALRERGVRFEPLPAERGVETPIIVRGKLGGVEYWSSAGPMIADCRMALALDRVGPEFVALGIQRVRFSGAYVYRTSRTGRLSLHAYGLAVDMHEVASAAGALSVRRDFERGLANGCAGDAPLLNQLACRLRAQGLFRELLTPDYNADHYDHLHLGLAPIPGAAAGLAATAPPAPRSARAQRGGASRQRKVATKNLSRKRAPQVEAARHRVRRRPVHVKATSASARVTRLGSDLKHLPVVPADSVGSQARNEPR